MLETIDTISVKIVGTVKKIQPLCPVFGRCGGCRYQDIAYSEELRIKEERLKTLLKERLGAAEDIFESITASPQEYHYRNRLDLKFVRTKQGTHILGFTPVEGSGIIPVESCAIARREISEFIPELEQQARDRLPEHYREANLAARSGDDARVLWGGIGRRSLELEEKDYFWTEIRGRRIFYSLDTFFQANLSILPKLFERLVRLDCWKQKPVLYDLYGGVGLFSIGLADLVKKAYLVDESKQSLKLARFNARVHQMPHVEVIRGRVENKLDALLAAEPAEQLKAAVIDPPRAGLHEKVRVLLKETRQLNTLLYLSCNPETLARDLAEITRGPWTIAKVVPFDFFPKTTHVEVLAVLSHQSPV